jgi:hypothetical protein
MVAKICISLIFSLLFLSSESINAKAQRAVHKNGSMLAEELTDQDLTRSSKVECCILKTVTAINQRLACDTSIAFGAAEINRRGGYVITEPGVYCLKEDVVFSPAETITLGVTRAPTKVSAITIDADHVVINLNNHTLSQGNTVPGVAGIEIAPEHNDISIINGNIERFTQAAIYSFIPDAVPQITSRNFIFKDLTITNNGVDGVTRAETDDGAGIALQDPGSASSPVELFNYKYYDVLIDNCNLTNNVGVTLMMAQVNGLVIQNSHADNSFINNAGTTPKAPNVVGMTMKNSVNISLQNSTFNNSTVASGPCDRCGGIRASNCFYVTIDECEFNGHRFGGTACTQLIGVAGGENSTWLVQNSQFCNIVNTGAPVSTVNGLHNSFIGGQLIQGGAYTVKNCLFSNISATPGSGISGVTAQANQSITVENCEFSNFFYSPAANPTDNLSAIFVQFTNAAPANDFIASVFSANILNCDIKQLVGGSVVACSFQMPNQLAKPCTPPCIPTFANVVVENTNVAHIVGSGSSAGIGLINLAVAATSPTFIFKNAAIRNNNVLDVRGAAGSAGIRVNNVKNPVVLNNVVEDCDTGILFTGSASTGYVNNGTVQNNNVSASTTGYQDDRPATTDSAWINNTAVRNGTNYNILWTGAAPIDVGSVIAPYPTPGNKYFNLSLN